VTQQAEALEKELAAEKGQELAPERLDAIKVENRDQIPDIQRKYDKLGKKNTDLLVKIEVSSFPDL
jgi:hypothetical protein